MLSLQSHNYEMNNLMATEYKYIDRNITGRTSIPGVGYIRNKYINCALAPLAFNEIGILNHTYTAENIEELNVITNEIENTYNNLSDTRLAVLRIYTNAVDITYNNLSSDLFTEPPVAVQELYNKCMDQVRLRQLLTTEVKTKIKLARGKHLVVLISDYSDDEQASDYFLTIGLIPILFPDWKERFNETELEYFKVLVNRSQVKRISNVKATEQFYEVMDCPKYRDLITDIRLNQAIEGIVDNKIRNMRQTVNDSTRSAEDYLRRYEEAKRNYYKAQELLVKLEHDRETEIEEVRLAVRMEGVVDVEQYNGNTLGITFVTPVAFYNTDECECIVDRLEDGDWTKQFLTEVFLEQKYKMYIYSKFYFSYGEDSRFNSPGEVPIETLKQHRASFNPHTHYFQCLGDYKPRLIDAQAKNDLLLFNNIALASTKSINFRDGAVINRWLGELRNWADSNNYYAQLFLSTDFLEDAEGKRHSLRELYLDAGTELEVEDL